MTHSPAPWRSCRGKNLRINDADGVYICSISRRGRHGESAEVIANMDLIEAAPELLEALERLHDIGYLSDHGCASPRGRVALQAARKAIDKAKGVSPGRERRPASPTITLNAGRSSAEDDDGDD